MKKTIVLALTIFILVGLFVLPQFSQAIGSLSNVSANNQTNTPNFNNNTGPVTTGQNNQSNNQSNNGPVDLHKPIIDFKQPVNNSVSGLLSRAVNILLGLIAGVSIIFIMIGGFRLAFSQGKSEAVTTAKRTITWAIAGLVIALMAFAIVRIVISILY